MFFDEKNTLFVIFVAPFSVPASLATTVHQGEVPGRNTTSLNPQRQWIMKPILVAIATLVAIASPVRAVVAQQDSAQADTTEKKKVGLPLEAGRVIPISTTEASWLSLDVSPDGETIVFDLLGDIYTIPFEGGKAMPITTGMAFDGQPRFSPDGKSIVFTSDGNGGENLWILDLETGDTTQLTKAKVHRYQSPEWSPDGQYIVASRAGLRSGVGKIRLWHKLAVECYLPAVPTRGLRSRDGSAVHPLVSRRVGSPAHAVPRWQVVGLRYPTRREDRPQNSRSRVWRRTLVGISDPAR